MLERIFGLSGHGTNVRTEVLAGFTTFLTMAYIVVVNPAILGDAGMPVAAVAAATCLAAGFGSLLMGLVANYPLALAPGMGLNAYFTYTVVKGMGVPWETALGCVFISGAAFLVLTLVGVRQLIVAAVPRSLFAAVAAGVGVFIAFIGLRDAGIIVPNPATAVALGDLTKPTAALSILGLLVIGALQAWRVKGAMLIGILVTAAAGWALGLAHVAPGGYSLTAISGTAFKLDIPSVLNLKGNLGLTLLEIVFVFLFVDLFDNVGTLVAVTKRAGLVDEAGKIPRLNRILVADSVATMAGALAGTSTVTSYIESASGVAAGGRTGLTSVVVGVLFLITLIFAPLVQAIPSAATAPALILVGALMMSAIVEVDWSDPGVAIPAFLTVVVIPLTYSIANGLAFGITGFAALKLLRGQARRSDWLLSTWRRARAQPSGKRRHEGADHRSGVVGGELEEDRRLVRPRVAAGQVREAAEGYERRAVDQRHLGDRGALHVEHLGLEGRRRPAAQGGVVDEGRPRNPVAADHHARGLGQAPARPRTALQRHLARHALGHRQQRRVGGEPLPALARAVAVGDVHGRRIDHAERRCDHLVARRRREVAGPVLPGHDALQVLAPLAGRHDIAHVQARIDAAGDAGEDDAGHMEAVERRLGGHGRVDHADPAEEQHHRLALQDARREGRAAGHIGVLAGGGLSQGRQLRREGRDHRGARRVVEDARGRRRLGGAGEGEGEEDRGEAHGGSLAGTRCHRTSIRQNGKRLRLMARLQLGFGAAQARASGAMRLEPRRD